MPLDGPRIFRSALLIEAAANAGAIVPLILYPKLCLSYLSNASSQATPAALSLVQWLGAIFVLPTVPLLISYPEPMASQPLSLVTERRRMTYSMLAISEIALGAVVVGQYFLGDSGIKDSVLLKAMANFAVLISWRAFCLFVRPEWVEARSSSGKAR